MGKREMDVEDLTCSICLDIFTPPILMTDHCGHNFCHACISNFIADQENWNCPECRSEQTKQPDNLVRNRLVEKAVKQFYASQDCLQHKNEQCWKCNFEKTCD